MPPGSRVTSVLLAAAVLSAAFSAISLSSCSRRAREEAPAASRAAERSLSAESRAQKPTPATVHSGDADAKRQGSKEQKPVLAAAQRAFGLGSPNVARMPQDYSIGPLQDYRAASEEEAGIAAIAKLFMDGMAARRLDPSLLVPDARDALALLLAPPPAAEATKSGVKGGEDLPYRLGAVKAEGDSASLRVRLPSTLDEGRAGAILSLGKIDGSWYVAAMSMDNPQGEGADAAPPVFDRSE